VFDETYYKGKKGSYKKGGYNFEAEYARLTPLAVTFHQLGVKKAMDIGCATGPLVKAFLDTGIEAYGVDTSEWATKNSPVASRLLWLDVDKDDVPFPDEFFDLVTMKFVIEHLYRPEKILKEIFRVLKPGGYLYIMTDKPTGDFSRQVGHVNVRSKNSWLNLLKGMNFRASKIKYLHFTMFYLYQTVEFGPIAKKFLLHKCGFVGRIIRCFFKIAEYLLDASTYILVLK
jgi:ubiquinone/menaquinone biosynthesis C-methylase UbiE